VLKSSITAASLVIYHCPELIDELKGAIIKQTPRGWKFEHTGNRHNDCLVTVGMALLECFEGQFNEPTFYFDEVSNESTTKV